MAISRRTLLRGGAGVLAAAAASRLPHSWAANGLTDRTVPGRGTAYNVLEIFFAGALSHRETLWVERPDEAPVLRRIAQLTPVGNPILDPSGAPADWRAWLPAPAAYQGNSHQLGSTATGAVHLGPCGEALVRPLSAGGKLADRLRVIATGHDFDVHEQAQEYMFQGAPFGSDRGAGTAAVIARHSGTPSFVFTHSQMNDARSSARAAAASGRHGPGSKPFVIEYDNPSGVGRLGAARSATRDALSSFYRNDYDTALTFANRAGLTDPRARSTAFDAYDAALGGAQASPRFVSAMSRLTASSGNSLWDNGTRRAIHASVDLLAGGQSRYCCVVDAGYVGDSFGGFSRYDSHSVTDMDVHAAVHTGNALNVLRTLYEEVDAGNLDLSTTLVVLNTEFGRTFSGSQSLGNGSHHCYRGFAVAMLGGPINTATLVGDLPFTSADDAGPFERDNPALATGGLLSGKPVSGTDLRAAVLMAAGVHPIQPDVFDQSETSAPTAPTREAAADQLATHIFG